MSMKVWDALHCLARLSVSFIITVGPPFRSVPVHEGSPEREEVGGTL